MSWESVNASEGYEHSIIALKEELVGFPTVAKFATAQLEGKMRMYDILTLSAKNIIKHT